MGRRLMWAALVAVAVAAVYGAIALATPATGGFVGTTIAKGTFADDIDVKNRYKNKTTRQKWEAELETEGASDLYVQSNVWPAGASTGWHTHPGHSLIIVTAGTLTAYEGDEQGCTAEEYSVGQAFVDPGGSHSHVIRNEGTVEATTTTIQLIPKDATRRVDAPNPGGPGCPF